MNAPIRVLLLASLPLAIACREGSVLQPDQGPNTEYPCGIQGVVCDDHMCCPSGHVCGTTHAGFFNRCEPGYCCADQDTYGSATDAGSDASGPPPHKVKARPAR